MRRDSPTLLIMEWFDRLWRRRDASAITELRTTRSDSHGLASEALQGPEAFAAFYQRATAVLTDTKVELLDAVESGDRAAIFVRFHAVTTKGRRFSVDGAGYLRIIDGRIASAHNIWNVGAAAVQLQLPACSTIDELIRAL